MSYNRIPPPSPTSVKPTDFRSKAPPPLLVDSGASTSTASVSGFALGDAGRLSNAGEYGQDGASDRSDSGVDSNLSRQSLPTTTPPASPGFLLSANLAMPSGVQRFGGIRHHRTPPPTPPYWVGNVTGAGSMSKKTGAVFTQKAPSTPPPSLKWGTSGSSTAILPRSRSHESQLPHRINQDVGKAGLEQFLRSKGSSGILMSQSMHESLPTPNADVAVSPSKTGNYLTISNSRSSSIAPPPSPKTQSRFRMSYDVPHR